MKTFLIMCIIMCYCATAIGADMQVVTEYGYFKDSSGTIVAKARLPKGKHSIKDTYTYHEVADQAALDLIVVWKEPVIPSKTFKEKILDLLDDEDIKNKIKTIK